MDPLVKDYLTKKYIDGVDTDAVQAAIDSSPPKSGLGGPQAATPTPDLRSQFQAAQDDSGVQDARKRAGYMNIAGAGAEALGQAIANANSRPVVLAQGWGKTDAPTVLGMQKNQVNGDIFRQAGEQGITNAKEDRANKTQAFWDQEKLGDMATKRSTDAQKFNREKTTWGQQDEDRKDSKARQAKEDAFKEGQQGRLLKAQGSEDDPNSPDSQLARTLAKKYLPQFDSSGLTATQMKDKMPWLEKAYTAEQQRLGRLDQIGMMKDQRDQTRQDKQDDKAAKAAEKEALVTIPGYDRNKEVGVRPEDAANLRKSKAEYDSLKSDMDAYKDMVKKNGSFEWGGENGAKMSSLYTSMQMRLKNLYELGALSGPDKAILESQIQDPSSLGSLFSRDKTVQAGLDSTSSSLGKGVDSKMSAAGYSKAGAAPHPQDDEAVQWAKANPNDPRSAAILKANGQ